MISEPIRYSIYFEFPLANRFAIGKCRGVLNSEGVRFAIQNVGVPPIANYFAISRMMARVS